MNSLGFHYSRYQKGYEDEQPDVIEDRKALNAHLDSLHSTHLPPLACSDKVHPDNLRDPHVTQNLVTIYYDESSFHTYKGRTRG